VHFSCWWGILCWLREACSRSLYIYGVT